MALDAPKGLTNAHVVHGRRKDHVAPKAARVRPPHEKAADVTTEDLKVDDAAPAKKSAAKATGKG